MAGRDMAVGRSLWSGRFGLFTSAQALVLSVVIIVIGFDATMAAMSLAE